VTCPAINWNDTDVELGVTVGAPNKPLRQYAFGRRRMDAVGDTEPATADLPEGQSFSAADAVAIGLRLLRTDSLPVVEDDGGGDL
jgi:hypothetical protein